MRVQYDWPDGPLVSGFLLCSHGAQRDDSNMDGPINGLISHKTTSYIHMTFQQQQPPVDSLRFSSRLLTYMGRLNLPHVHPTLRKELPFSKARNFTCFRTFTRKLLERLGTKQLLFPHPPYQVGCPLVPPHPPAYDSLGDC